MDYEKEILNITSEYFTTVIDDKKLIEANGRYKELLTHLGGTELDNTDGIADIDTNDGKAIGTYWAALCLDDFRRTRSFIRGIDKAIVEKLKTQPNLHILYSGTGPFAPLILPSIFKYKRYNIRYTLLEINHNTFNVLKKIYDQLNLKKLGVSIANKDAVHFKLDVDDKPDIILSETLQNGLIKEHQVPIFLNLMSQAKEDCFFLPEKIQVSIGLRQKGVSEEELSSEHYSNKKLIIEISKQSFPKAKINGSVRSKQDLFPKTETTFLKEELKGFSSLNLLTEISVFNDEKIELFQSGLTVPMYITEINNSLKDLTISSEYKLDSHPRLEYEIL